MWLGSRRIISVKGEGITGFLQGLVTQDMTILSQQKTAAAVFLSSKGRVMTESIIVNHGNDGLFLEVPAVHVDSLVTHLVRHKLRLPIHIEKFSDWGVKVGEGLEDPRLASLGNRLITQGFDESESEPKEYRKNRFLNGVVEGQDLPQDSIPIFYNFDFLNSIAFAKGCYSGQELVTRTIRRGVVRKRVVPVTLNSEVSIELNSPVVVGGKEVGNVLASEGEVGLAVLQFESGLNEKAAYCETVRTLASHPVTIGGKEGKIRIPGYCLA
jgi:folate-binding protein YgfZ